MSGLSNHYDVQALFLYMRALFFLAYFALSISVNAQIDQYLTDYQVSNENGAVLITWTTSAGFTCEDIKIQSSTDSNQLETIYTYPGICGSEQKAEKYTYLFREVVYNQPNYFKIDLGSYGVSDILSINIIEVDGLNPKVYPNPATHLSTLIFSNANKEEAIINVYNGSGEICVPPLSTREDSVKIESLNLDSPGLYFYTIEIKGILRRGKFLFL